MQAFSRFSGVVAPIDRGNVDTDAIIPKQFLKSIKKTGFGPHLFDAWRYLDEGQPGMDCSTRPLNPQFTLNQPRYRNASILLGRENFGCGSSREHATWALADYGIRALIAPSYAEIFHNNCMKNGVLAITVDTEVVDRLFDEVEKEPGYALIVDLEQQHVETPSGMHLPFEINPFTKYCLLNGLDDIALVLRHRDAIRDYENRRRELEPWLFASP
jgi:3-isopropylmalate/(R)-2-methylmalate dehydratase small subunit